MADEVWRSTKDEQRIGPEVLLLTMAQALVNRPGDVSVRRHDDERGSTFTVTCDPSDVGSIVGKEGRLARSMRNIMLAHGARSKKVYMVNIHNPREVPQ